jgi:A/G-specific adenine glycosylase
MNPVEFQLKLLDWFDRHGRKDLPWQQHISPYRVWVSEIMLQQTQVSAVEPYFEKFMRTFPDVHALANATSDDVLVHWAGLGYYARARNLHRAAQVIVQQGCFPDTVEDLVKLPGIGRSTAGAIVSIACKKFAPILDGNVKRVLSRFLAIEGWPGKADVAKRLWAASERFSPESRTADYTQAIMDLGATLCTKSQPGCQVCPLAKSCQAHLNDNVAAYPARKKAKPLPVRESCLLLAQTSGQQVLLEKKPPSGIWGGLWSLPEFDNADGALDWCRQQRYSLKRFSLGEKKRHTFSHFHLDFVPLLAEIENPPNEVADQDRWVWHDRSQLHLLGLPAPVKKILLT